jgi:hypothetical protein
MKVIRTLLALVAMLMFASSAWALSFQDKQDRSINNSGETLNIPSGASIQETASDTYLTGSETLTVYTCPANKLCNITKVGYNYVGTVTNVRVALLADDLTVDQDGAPTTNETNAFTVDLWLDENETIKLTPMGATASDDLYGFVHGIEYSGD